MSVLNGMLIDLSLLLLTCAVFTNCFLDKKSKLFTSTELPFFNDRKTFNSVGISFIPNIEYDDAECNEQELCTNKTPNIANTKNPFLIVFIVSCFN